MKKLIALTLLIIVSTSFLHTKKEKWITLFNGKDIDNWTVKIYHHEVGDNYGNTFRVEDGLIKVRYDQYDLFQYTLFLLQVEI